jgi:RNA exonuclease 4
MALYRLEKAEFEKEIRQKYGNIRLDTVEVVKDDGDEEKKKRNRKKSKKKKKH